MLLAIQVGDRPCKFLLSLNIRSANRESKILREYAAEWHVFVELEFPFGYSNKPNASEFPMTTFLLTIHRSTMMTYLRLGTTSIRIGEKLTTRSQAMRIDRAWPGFMPTSRCPRESSTACADRGGTMSSRSGRQIRASMAMAKKTNLS